MSKSTSILGLLFLFLILAMVLAPMPSTTAKSNAGDIVYLPIVQKPIGAPVLKWQKGGCQTTWCRTGWYTSPAVADLDGDTQPEVIGVDYRVVVVNGEDGSDQWVVPSPGGGGNRSWPGVVVADVDNNSSLEIISAYGDGYLSVLNANGTAYSGWPKQVTPGNELRSLAVDDVDGNNDLEILVCSTRSDDQWFLFNHTGSIYHPNWPVHYPDDLTNGFAAGCFNENVGLADLDKDGRSEMIGPNDTHYVVGYNDDATPLYANAIYGDNKPWARVGFHLSHEVDLRGYAHCGAGDDLEPRPNFADSAPTFADVNGDGTLEIIIVGNQYDCRTSPYTSLYHLPYILNVDRTRWSGNGYDWTVLPVPDAQAGPLSENYSVIETVQPNPVATDLDGDGLLEILYASYDGRIHAYWLDKTEHGNWPYAVTQAGEGIIRFASEPVVVDLDNNGKAEVIFNTWTQIGSNRAGELIILNWDGSLLHRVSLPRSSKSWDGALSAPTIANIDSDADYEAVVSTAYTGLVAYDLPGTANARILWATGRGSYLRTGQALP